MDILFEMYKHLYFKVLNLQVHANDLGPIDFLLGAQPRIMKPRDTIIKTRSLFRELCNVFLPHDCFASSQ